MRGIKQKHDSKKYSWFIAFLSPKMWIISGLLLLFIIAFAPMVVAVLIEVILRIVVYGGIIYLILAIIDYILNEFILKPSGKEFRMMRPINNVLGRIFKKSSKKSVANSNNADTLNLNGETEILNPSAGILIVGGAGSGKSKSIIEPLIKDCGKKGYTGVIYDFKFPELANYVNTAYSDQGEIKKYFVNFSDLSRSHRINPVAPEVMQNVTTALQLSFSIFSNLDRSIVSRSGDTFWIDNAYLLLGSCFWYLKKNHPDLCTVPHAISMINYGNIQLLLNTLATDNECRDLVASIMTAAEQGNERMLTGQLGAALTPLAKINTKENYWILGRSDFSLDLNNSNSKGILVIGNNPSLSDAQAPVIGLIMTAVSKVLNQQGKEKSVFMADEFPTLYLPGVEQLPATARSNKVATVLAAQDLAQIVDKYGSEKAESILSNLGNQFYGRTTNPGTAERVSKLFGKYEKQRRSSSYGDGINRTYSKSEADVVKAQELFQTQTGAFYTILSEGNIRTGISVVPMDKDFVKTEIQPFNAPTEWDLNQNFTKIKNDVTTIIFNIQNEVTDTETDSFY